jgi:hypothetical protein
MLYVVGHYLSRGRAHKASARVAAPRRRQVTTSHIIVVSCLVRHTHTTTTLDACMDGAWRAITVLRYNDKIYITIKADGTYSKHAVGR